MDPGVVIFRDDVGGVLAHDRAQHVVFEHGAQRDRHLARGGDVAAQAGGVGESRVLEVELPGDGVHGGDEIVGRHPGGAAERGRRAVVGGDEHRA